MEACGCSRRFPPGGDKGGMLVLYSKDRPGLDIISEAGEPEYQEKEKIPLSKRSFLGLAMSSLRGLGTITGAMCFLNSGQGHVCGEVH